MKNNIWPFVKSAKSAIPVWFTKPAKLDELKKELPPHAISWARSNGYAGAHGKVCIIPGEAGNIAGVLFGFRVGENPLDCGGLVKALPPGTYRFANTTDDMYTACLGIALASYRFDRYRESAASLVRFVLPSGFDADRLRHEADATKLVRDLINTPTSDMGPGELEKAFRKLANAFRARVAVVSGDNLLKQNLPMIHAVGRASSDAPRLLDMKWGKATHPKITLVGKGVCFDTGGLNIKPGGSMALMKKDMGGAANVMGLAQLIMACKLPVRLRVLVPAVENSISGNAFRPGDILHSRKGLTVEIGNTDAEGRLVLADALSLACEEKPDLIVDMATLTGAARVALGPDLPPVYCDDKTFADEVLSAAQSCRDPLWPMPLWQPYEKMLDSKVADTNHITSGGFAGSVTAALFLKKFVEPGISWMHLDVFGWVPSAKPWAAIGGEAQGIRALFAAMEKRYGNTT